MTIDVQLDALTEFSSSQSKEMTDTLESILTDIAKSGQYIHQWHLLKPLFVYKLEKVTEEFLSQNPPLLADGNTDEAELNKMTDFRKGLLETFEHFTLAPFTMQRIAELLLHPSKYYKSAPKFFRGLEKNITVVSTIDPISPEQKSILKRSLEAKTDNETSNEDIAAPPAKKLIENNKDKQDEHNIEAELRCNESVDEETSIKNFIKDEMECTIDSSSTSSETKDSKQVDQSAHITSSSTNEMETDHIEKDKKDNVTSSDNVVSTTIDVTNCESNISINSNDDNKKSTNNEHTATNVESTSETLDGNMPENNTSDTATDNSTDDEKNDSTQSKENSEKEEKSEQAEAMDFTEQPDSMDITEQPSTNQQT